MISRDAGRARVGDQLGRERGADAAVLVLVGDGERDLGAVAPSRTSRAIATGLRIALDVGHERVVARVDRRELAELDGAAGTASGR